MPRTTKQRRWYLEPKERRIYLIREDVEISSYAGTAMGAIKDISIGKEHAKGPNSKQALLVSHFRICDGYAKNQNA